MSMKPGLMPINPKDARSAIRAYKMLESDIVRINQDMRTKRVCDVEGARFSIQRKQRQLTDLKNWMRSYHVDMSQFDRLEAQRQEQAMRKQHAIFETQRKDGIPVKGSPEQKAAVHNQIIESVPTPTLPPATPPYVPPELIIEPQIPVPKPKTPPLPPKGTTPAITPDPPEMDSNWIELALTKADWLRYNRSDPVWLQNVISHQRLRVRKGEYRNIVEAKTATEREIEKAGQKQKQEEMAKLLAAEETRRRGQQALLEEQSRQAAKQTELELRLKQAEMERIKLEESNAKHASQLLEQRREREKQLLHERRLAAQNEERRQREAAEEAAQRAREQANAIRKHEDEFKQMEQGRRRQEEGRRRNRDDLDAARRAAEPIFEEINEIETMILPGLDREMQHSKMYNPEIMQDLAGDRERHLSHLKMLKSQVAPLIAAVRAESNRSGGVSVDNTAGLRMWHKNLFTNKSKRNSAGLCKYLESNYDIKSLPTNVQEKIRNILSSYEYGKFGSESEAQSALDSIILENQLQSGQASKNAAALSGTPRHMRHGKSALLPNNYQRLRQIQSSEEQERAVIAANKQVAENKSQLAGMFPKLRDSVTRMVGY